MHQDLIVFRPACRNSQEFRLDRQHRNSCEFRDGHTAADVHAASAKKTSRPKFGRLAGWTTHDQFGFHHHSSGREVTERFGGIPGTRDGLRVREAGPVGIEVAWGWPSTRRGCFPVSPQCNTPRCNTPRCNTRCVLIVRFVEGCLSDAVLKSLAVSQRRTGEPVTILHCIRGHRCRTRLADDRYPAGLQSAKAPVRRPQRVERFFLLCGQFSGMAGAMADASRGRSDGTVCLRFIELRITVAVR